MPIGWISEIGPKAFTLGVKTESRKIILMFKRQDLTRPQLQELGPPRMEGQFVALGPLSNFIKILFDKRSAPEDGLEIERLFLVHSFFSFFSYCHSLSLSIFIQRPWLFGPEAFTLGVEAPVILLLKWPLEADLEAIRAQI